MKAFKLLLTVLCYTSSQWESKGWQALSGSLLSGFEMSTKMIFQVLIKSPGVPGEDIFMPLYFFFFFLQEPIKQDEPLFKKENHTQLNEISGSVCLSQSIFKLKK